ncbi:MAG: ABC transporter ATP-binding protein [Tissierellia bacterium]|nr:ABC transporter ATP-binding protein [Tissierellia bacterium]
MKVYKKLFTYVGIEKFYGIIAIIFSTISFLLTIYGYYSMFKFLNAIIVHKDLDLGKSFAVNMSIALTAGGITYLLSGLFSHVLGFRLETNLRKRGIDGLTDSSFRFFDLNSTGFVRKTIDDNAAQTHQIVAHMIPDNAQAFLGPIFTVALAFFVSTRVGIVIILLAIFAGVTLQRMMGDQEFLKKYQKSLEVLSSETVEYVRGMQVVKIFGAKVDTFKALYRAIKEYSKYAYDYTKSCKSAYVWYQWLFFGLVSLLIIPISLYISDLGNPEILAVDLIMTLFLSGLLLVAFLRVMWISMYIYKANYAVDTLEALYKSMNEDKLSFGEDTKIDNYDIEFKNVSFGYNENSVIENLSFKLEEGKSYALVGSSGSGKTTIAKLISGFYKVDEGKILIGNKPIENYTHETIIKAISFVFQDPKLFKKSIYDNVAIANKNATRDEVLKAMTLAGCDQILDKFPERENTIIGSKGVYLSGGEKQRVAIARAILKDSRIIIMDEASASIDPDNEHELQKAFSALIKDKTVVMIAHRLSSIRAVDEIIVLEDGKIIERGSNLELLNSDSKYKKLLDLYNSANEWRVGYEETL